MKMIEKAVKALRRITASRNRGAKEKIKINRSRDSDLLRTSPRDIKHNKLVEVRNRTKQALAWVRLLHLLQKNKIHGTQKLHLVMLFVFHVLKLMFKGRKHTYNVRELMFTAREHRILLG